LIADIQVRRLIDQAEISRLLLSFGAALDSKNRDLERAADAFGVEPGSDEP
jgi:hypothetical protein